RPSIGRAPPAVLGARRRPNRAPSRPAVRGDSDRYPLTPVTRLTRENSATRSGSANGLAQPSRCTTRRAAAGHPLAEPLRPAPAPRRTRRTQTRTDGTTQAAPEVHPMTDLTTRPTEHGTPGPALAPVLEPAPVNGAAFGDRRTLRQVSRAEQDRLSADA